MVGPDNGAAVDSAGRAVAGAPTPDVGTCPTCGARIFFAPSTLSSLTTMPINAEPDITGNVVIEDGAYRVLSKAEREGSNDLFNPVPMHPGPLYTSHFATCPDAQAWRERTTKR